MKAQPFELHEGHCTLPQLPARKDARGLWEVMGSGLNIVKGDWSKHIFERN